MSKCKHDLRALMGTADGIVCRACGAVFKSFEEIEASRKPEAEKPAEEAPKKPRKKKEDA